MSTFRFSLALIPIAIGAIFITPTAMAATSCSYKNFVIGSEIIAKDGPNPSGEYLYQLTTLRCDPSGTVIYDSGMGFSENYEIGWRTPASLTDDPSVQAMAYNMRSFKNKCGTLLQNVHKLYRGSVAGINLNGAYPPAATPYVDIFKNPLYMTWGANVPPCELPPPPPPPPSFGDGGCGGAGGGAGGSGGGSSGSGSGGGSSSSQELGSTCGNPINFTTGSKIQYQEDYQDRELSFARRYDSQSPFVGSRAGALGPRWTHNHDYRLVEVTAGSQLYVVRPNGRIAYFTPKVGQANVWTSAANITDTVIKTANGWEYQNQANEVEAYDATGRLLSRLSPSGDKLTYSYNPANQLETITDVFGRKLTLTYNANGQLAQVTRPDANLIKYAYDAQGQLSSVTQADNSTRQYGYTTSSVNGVVQGTLLNQLIDENGTVFATWAYTDGAATQTTHAGMADSYTVTYQRDASNNIIKATVLNPLNGQEIYSIAPVLGRNLPQDVLRAFDNAKKTQLFDVNGNLTSVTDFNGTTTLRSYDLVRNLEISRTEAKGTPQERIIITEWHPTWRLIRKVTEPGRITTYDWDNTTANLNSKTITADGKTRAWSWTYFDKGLIKTATDPDGKVTSYTYDAAGNLATVTNPLNQITQFIRYDANGNLLEMIAADGIKTTLTYDARNRLKTQQTGTALTSYDYWPTGLLKQATLPSGQVITYTYDAAQRLTGVSDNRGNSVTYRLNNLGQAEQVDRYDPNGTLAVGLAQTQSAQAPLNAVVKAQ